jgi:hypothetical protein
MAWHGRRALHSGPRTVESVALALYGLSLADVLTWPAWMYPAIARGLVTRSSVGASGRAAV